MAGMLPMKSCGRKQWTLHDGPRGSLRRLRNQLAEDGCPESQVVLAKQLLDEKCDLDIDKNENARLAVYWLVKSSEQGNEEATYLLKKCFRTGRGINEHNYMDVKSCINMNRDEKLARKAAREVFISLSNGEDFITSEQLEKRMLEIYYDEDDLSSSSSNDAYMTASVNGNGHSNIREYHNDEGSQEIDWSTRSNTKNEKLSEDNIVSAAVDYSHGHLPALNQALCLTKPDSNSLNHIPYIYRLIFHPIQTLRVFYYNAIEFVSSLPNFAFYSALAWNLWLLFLAGAYITINAENKLGCFFLTVYYTSLVIMVICTFRMLHVRSDYVDLHLWSGLFLQYSGGSLNADEAEFLHIQNNLKPYGHFFVALLINLLIYPIVQTEWIPESELTIIALVLMFLTLITFMKNSKKSFPDYLMLFSFAINVLAKYPYESDAVVTKGWRFLDLKIPSFTSYVIGNGVEFCINFRLLFLCLIPICFGKMAVRDRWRGVYKFVIPHCVTLSWLQMAIICSKGATMYGLLRGTLAIVGSVLFLPLTALTVIHLPVVIVVNYIYESDYMITFIALGVFAVLTFCGSHILTKMGHADLVGYFQAFITTLISCIILSHHFYNQSENHSLETVAEIGGSPLTLQQYLKYCDPQARTDSNFIDIQQSCAHFDGLRVEWDGYVEKTRIRSVDNKHRRIIGHFPEFMQDYLRCWIGERYGNKCASIQTDCVLLKEFAFKSQCHLEQYNRYTYEVEMQVSTGVWAKPVSVYLVAKNPFGNFTRALKRNDKVYFKGYLTNDYSTKSDELLGGSKPIVELVEIECIACEDESLTRFKVVSHSFGLKDVVQYLFVGGKSILNFLFNPIVLFK